MTTAASASLHGTGKQFNENRCIIKYPLSGGSAHRYDEIFVKLPAESAAQHPLYDAYVTHYDDALKGATPRN